MVSKKLLASLLSGALISTPTLPYCVKADEVKTTDDILWESKGSAEFNQMAKDLAVMSEKGFKFQDSDIVSYINSTNDLTLDIFFENNLDIVLKEGIKFILNESNESYMDNKEEFCQPILNNMMLVECLENTVKYLEKQDVATQDKQLEIAKRIKGILKLMEIDDSINKDHAFKRFLIAVKNAYVTMISRRIAAEILEEYRGSVESKMSSENVARDAEISANAAESGIDIGIGIGAESKEGSSEKSFYRIDNSGSVSATIGAGVAEYLAASCGFSIEVTSALIFYSLEQFLDASILDGKLTSIRLRKDDISKIIKSRKEMQDAEKSLLATIHTGIEWYIKAAAVIPQNVNVKWPEPTFAHVAAKERTLAATIDIKAVAKCLAALGMDLSASKGVTKSTVYSSYLSLLNEDCRVSESGGTFDDLIKFLNQSDCKKFGEIKAYVESYFGSLAESMDVEDRAEAFSIIVSNIIGDLKHYNSSLAIIADETSSKEAVKSAKDVKHSIESDWIATSAIKRMNKGRLEMLKAAIVIAAYLREYADIPEEIDLFKSLYAELEHLVRLQMFSSSVLKNDAKFNTTREIYYSKVSGVTYLTIPFVGTTDFNISYTDAIGDAYFDTNQDIVVSVQIPVVGQKVLGTDSIKNKFKEMATKLSAKTDEAAAQVLANAVKMVDDKFDGLLNDFGIEKVISIPGVVSVNKYITLNFYLTKIAKTNEVNYKYALPGCDYLSKDDDEWVLKLSKRIDYSKAELKAKGSSYGVDLKDSVGRAKSKMGTDTLMFVSNKFTALALGTDFEKLSEPNSLWTSFKADQEPQFKELFNNIAKNESNSKYELQQMFGRMINGFKTNDGLDYTQKSSLSKKCSKKFESFCTACKDYVSSSDEKEQKEKFAEVSKLFDQILELNYRYNWLTEFKQVHSISKK